MYDLIKKWLIDGKKIIAERLRYDGKKMVTHSNGFTMLVSDLQFDPQRTAHIAAKKPSKEPQQIYKMKYYPEGILPGSKNLVWLDTWIYGAELEDAEVEHHNDEIRIKLPDYYNYFEQLKKRTLTKRNKAK